MQLISYPSNFSSAFCSNNYTFSGVNINQIVNISVMKSSAPNVILGTKRFKGETSFDVNVTNYIRRELNPKPKAQQTTGFFFDDGRNVSVQLRWGASVNNLSQITTFVSAHENLQTATLLSLWNEKRTIAKGEFDEVSFTISNGDRVRAQIVVKDGRNTTKNIYLTSTKLGVLSLLINVDNLLLSSPNPSTAEEIIAKIYINENLIGTVNYEIISHSNSAVRLCWLNSLGVIDFHTFDVVGQERIVCDKKRIQESQGFRTVSANTSREIDLVTACLPKKQTDVLAEIISSTRVWRVINNNFQKIDVVTDSAKIYGIELKPLNITIRYIV